MADVVNSANFQEWWTSLPIPWLYGGPVGQAEAGALGDVLDDQVDQLKQAVKARMPGLAPVDALPHLANQRQLIQGPTETNAAFALRLQCADVQWQYAGSALSILVQLYFQGLAPYAVLVQQNGLAFTLTGTLPAFVVGQPWDPSANLTITNLGTNPNITGSPPWWSFDVNTGFCSRYALLFPTMPTSWTNIVNPPTPTTGPTLSQINTIRSILKSWAKGSATCLGIYVQASGRMIGYPPRLINSGPYAGSTIGPSTTVRFAP